jgi:predicted nuclease of predicted toxin-antitoxin system
LAEHVADVGLTGRPDQEIWAFAEKVQAVIVTKDEDFARLRSVKPDGPSIVWVRFGNTRKRMLLRKISPQWPRIIERLNQGERLVDVSG